MNQPPIENYIASLVPYKKMHINLPHSDKWIDMYPAKEEVLDIDYVRMMMLRKVPQMMKQYNDIKEAYELAVLVDSVIENMMRK